MVKWPSDIRSRSSCITSMPRLLNLLNLVVLIVLFVLAHQVGRLSADNWEYKLVHDLLDGYDSSIRPSVHHNVTLNVTFGLALAQLIDVVLAINSQPLLKVLFILFYKGWTKHDNHKQLLVKSGLDWLKAQMGSQRVRRHRVYSHTGW